MVNLGFFYETGLGVSPFPEQARKLYEKAAEMGNSWGIFKIFLNR